MEYFTMLFKGRKKNEVEKKPEEASKMISVEEVVAKKKSEFVPEISMFELENADWKSFCARLKARRIMPNSYVKKPVQVQVALDKKNKPMVLLTFVSETSDSVREILLRQGSVSQSINGVVNGKNNEQIKEVWLEFQNYLRAKHSREIGRDAVRHKKQGQELRIKAEKMIELEGLPEDELAFIETYQNAVFDEFCCSRSGKRPPEFSVLGEGGLNDIEWITPFSPKTLELCLTRLPEERKVDEGFDIDEFLRKCEQIKVLSGYESKDWDKVIGYGEKMMREAWERAEAQENKEFSHSSGIVKF